MEAAKQMLPSVVASEIVALLNGPTMRGDRRLLPEDIAALVPRNHQAELLQKALIGYYPELGELVPDEVEVLEEEAVDTPAEE